MTPDEQAIFAGALSALKRRRGHHLLERAACLALGDHAGAERERRWGGRILDAIDGLHELRAEMERAT